LNLECDILVSKFAFKFNLCRYILALSRVDRGKGILTADDIMKAGQTLMEDTYVKSLAGGSVLELLLVVAMSRLHRFRQMQSFNFNHVENELKTMAANDFLGGAVQVECN
jgi:hypothetical protein